MLDTPKGKGKGRAGLRSRGVHHMVDKDMVDLMVDRGLDQVKVSIKEEEQQRITIMPLVPVPVSIQESHTFQDRRLRNPMEIGRVRRSMGMEVGKEGCRREG